LADGRGVQDISSFCHANGTQIRRFLLTLFIAFHHSIIYILLSSFEVNYLTIIFESNSLQQCPQHLQAISPDLFKKNATQQALNEENLKNK